MIIQKTELKNPITAKKINDRIQGLCKILKMDPPTTWNGPHADTIEEYFYISFETKSEKGLKYIFRDGNF